jgi:hypothetical protein
MSTYNFSKTKINYDGNVANVDMSINDNGNKDFVSLQLTNNDLIKLFGTKPIDKPLEKRLYDDFFMKPMALEGAIKKPKSNSMKHKRRRKYLSRRRIN